MPSEKPYIFIVGFNKTGTRTLTDFFARNGHEGVHWDNGNLVLRMLENLCSGRKIFYGYDHASNVYSDMTFVNNKICIEGSAYFRQMDKDYPDSFFIYNTRNIDSWVNSRLRHGDGSYLERYKSILNTESIDEITNYWIKLRLDHEDKLRSYFKDSKRLLTVDIESADSAQKVKDFLGMDLDTGHWGWVGKTGES